MRLPSTKRRDDQLRFELPLGSHAYARNILGDFVEELTAKLFRGRRLKTDSRCDYCPDIEARGLYIECKSAGRSRQTFIYAGRLEKDREFAREHRLVYIVWHHTAYTKECDTDVELRCMFLARLRSIYIVPFEFIDELLRGREAEPLNSKYGGTDRQTYGSGFRISVRELEPFGFAIERK
jgi:hypothetical protein